MIISDGQRGVKKKVPADDSSAGAGALCSKFKMENLLWDMLLRAGWPGRGGSYIRTGGRAAASCHLTGSGEGVPLLRSPGKAAQPARSPSPGRPCHSSTGSCS